jgi:hypothetical protein
MASELRVDRIIPVNGVPTGGGGGVIQMVHLFDDSMTTTTSSYTDIFTADLSITLKSLSNKIYIVATIPYVQNSNSGGSADLSTISQLVRTTSGSDVQLTFARTRHNSAADFHNNHHHSFVDSGFSSLTQTYNLQFARTGGNDTAYANDSQIVAMEFSG